MKENLLKGIGFTNWEYAAYTALLRLGSTTTGPLVKESAIPQSKIYSVLESLGEKGFASYTVKGKVKYFQAAKPERVMALFKDLEREVDEKLTAIMEEESERPSVQLYEGVKAIKAMLLMLTQDAKKNESYYAFGAGDVSKRKEIQDFYEWWGMRKYELGINDSLLISASDRRMLERAVTSEAMLEGLKRKTKYTEVLLPGNGAVFRNNVIIYNWEKVPTAMLITSNEVSGKYREFLLSLWKVAKA